MSCGLSMHFRKIGIHAAKQVRGTANKYPSLAVFPAKVGCFNQLKEVEPGNRALSGLKQTFNLPKQVDKRCNQWA